MIDKQAGFWVISDLTITGDYVATIQFSDDRSRALDRAGATAYAYTLLGACERADYDAAVVAQMTRKLGMPAENVPDLLRDVRAGRPPLDHAATSPLRFEPGISAKHRPFIAVHLEGEQVGQLSPKQARRHALGLMSTIEAISLDRQYLNFLVETIGIEPERARNVVHDVLHHRSKW